MTTPIRATSFAFVVGIDLGTTNSLLSIVRWNSDNRLLPDGQPFVLDDTNTSLPNFVAPELLSLPQEMPDGVWLQNVLFPSAVYQDIETGHRIVGEGARQMKFSATQNRDVFFSVKRDLGKNLDPAYPSAVSTELNTPVKVSAVILTAMREAAEANLGQSLKDVPVVITIPASFQSAQRQATLEAARLAGFTIGEHALFDEPNAALLGYINRRRIQVRWHPEETVLVFDFGGGTCDISVVEVSYARSNQHISLKNRAISRYEELGGDDIDKHIVHTWLAEQFYQASGIPKQQWGKAELRRSIWSQLAKVAELLKTHYCDQAWRVAEMREWTPTAFDDVRVAIAPQVIHTSRGEVWLNELSMDTPIFQRLLDPFLDPDGLSDEGRDEYRITSIFTPVMDALEKANLTVEDITRVLLVGGSAQNPLVEASMRDFFGDATIERPQKMDTLVAEGAAVQAYWYFVKGHNILAPIVGDTIGLLTEGSRFVPLIQAGSSIPYPTQGDGVLYTHLKVPRDFMNYIEIVICAGSVDRPVHTARIEFDRIVSAHTSVYLQVRLDAHKVFHYEAWLPDVPNSRIKGTLENPLALVTLTPLEQERAELEKTLVEAQAVGRTNAHIADMAKMANVLHRLARVERAEEFIDMAIKRSEGQTKIQYITQKANMLFNSGQREEAFRLYTQYADRDPALACNAAVAAPDALSREKYARMALRVRADYGIAEYQLGTALAQQNRREEAKQAYEKAKTLLEREYAWVAKNSATAFYLAEVYDRLGQTAQAHTVRQQYQASQSNIPLPEHTHVPSVNDGIVRSH